VTAARAPERACVRVGSANAGPLIAGWPQACDCAGGRRPGWPAVTGTLLAADERSPVRRLETADVIVASTGCGRPGPAEWLRRYPGCAVAVARSGPDECSVASRSGVIGRMAVSGAHGDCGALACAVFTYGWILAGLPLAPLASACLSVGPVAAIAGPGGGRPLFFRFGYCLAPWGDSSPGAPGPLF
jgi:hypothetical protein